MNGLDEVERAGARRSRPRRVEPALRHRRRRDPPDGARARGGAERGVVYGRIGTCTQEFGTLASWLVDVLNVLTGNLDSRGRRDVHARRRRPAQLARQGRPRPRRHDWAAGTAACAGCPRCSASCRSCAWPRRSRRRARARSARFIASAATRRCRRRTAGGSSARSTSLEFMVSIDIYLNETTRHADVDPAGAVAARQVALRPRVLPVRGPQRGELLAAGLPGRRRACRAEWATLAAAHRRARRARGPTRTSRRSTTSWPAPSRSPPRTGGDPAELLAEVEPRRGPERLLDLMLRGGPYELTLADLEASPHGVDLGPLKPRVPEVLRTPSGKVELAPEAIVGRRAAPARVARPPPQRRDGADRPPPAALEQLVDAQPRAAREGQGPLHAARAPRRRRAARPRGRRRGAGDARAPARSTRRSRSPTRSCPASSRSRTAGATTRPAPACRWRRARRRELATCSTDELEVDPLSGNAVLNGIPVEVGRLRS